MKIFVGFVLLIPFVIWTGYRGCIAPIIFDRNCEGYLKRAADANTIELAKEQLKIALDYIEKEELTNGYTSVIYRTPDEDVGFWYKNLKVAYKELEEVKADATQLEKTNILMKLRETILDKREQELVTCPSGISVFPHNTGLAFGGVLLFIFAIIGGVCIGMGMMDDY